MGVQDNGRSTGRQRLKYGGETKIENVTMLLNGQPADAKIPFGFTKWSGKIQHLEVSESAASAILESHYGATRLGLP